MVLDIRAHDLDEGWVLLSQRFDVDDLHARPPAGDAADDAPGPEDAAGPDLSSSPPDDWPIEDYLAAPRVHKSKKKTKKRGKKKH